MIVVRKRKRRKSVKYIYIRDVYYLNFFLEEIFNSIPVVCWSASCAGLKMWNLHSPTWMLNLLKTSYTNIIIPKIILWCSYQVLIHNTRVYLIVNTVYNNNIKLFYIIQFNWDNKYLSYLNELKDGQSIVWYDNIAIEFIEIHRVCQYFYAYERKETMRILVEVNRDAINTSYYMFVSNIYNMCA